MTVAATEALTAANLWAELQNGPYASVIAPKITSGDDQGIANILNDKAGAHNGPVAHADMQASEVSAEVNWLEFDQGLTSGQKDTWNSIIAAQQVPIGSANVQSFFDLVFTVANCPNTRAALQALYTQTGSRSEVLFGTGVSVTAQQVNIARTTTGSGSF